MKFGQSTNRSNLLPKLPEPRFWQSFTATCQFYVGSTNWTEPYWKNLIYPARCKNSEYLNHYSNFFNTIELNTSYYRVPSVEMVQNWCSKTIDDFKFCPKVPSKISLHGQLGLNTTHWYEFNQSLDAFQDKLGIIFLQLPESFDVQKFNILESLIYGDDLQYPLLFEFRHASWFADPNTLAKLCSLLYQKNCGMIITDTPGRQDVLHLQICNHRMMIRYVSNGIPEDDQMRLGRWEKLLKRIAFQNLTEIYLMLHFPNPEELIQWARYWKDAFNIRLDGRN